MKTFQKNIKPNHEYMGRSPLSVFLALISVALFQVSCSTTGKSVATGAIAGAGVGAGTGLFHPQETRGEAVAISAGIGAVVGGVAGYLIHGSLKDRDTKVRKTTLFNLESHGIERPTTGVPVSDFRMLLSNPSVEMEWVETHIDGPKLVQGHKVFTITEGSRWNLTSDIPHKKKKRTRRKRGKSR
jgi:hypothetical protein